jgi:hypothetical protein
MTEQAVLPWTDDEYEDAVKAALTELMVHFSIRDGVPMKAVHAAILIAAADVAARAAFSQGVPAAKQAENMTAIYGDLTT